MKRCTVILSDDFGYADYHVLAEDKKVAVSKAILEHCKDDSEERKEERCSDRRLQPQAIFVYHGWCKYAKR